MELNARAEAAEPPTRRAWFRREAISLAELAVQTFAVVLGILLALAIDDWKKDRETARDVASAMAAVRTELDANQRELRAHGERLHALVKALDADAAAPAGVAKPCNEYAGWNGVGLPVLLDAAYRTAISTQTFAHMDFARAEAIATAYGRQATYGEYHGKLLDLLLRGQPTSLSLCRGIVAELAEFGDSIAATYAEALAAAKR